MIARLASALALFAGCHSLGCEASPRANDVHGAAPPAAQTTSPPRCSMSHPDTLAILTRHDLSGLSSSRGRGRQELAAIPHVTDHLLAIARAGDCDAETGTCESTGMGGSGG